MIHNDFEEFTVEITEKDMPKVNRVAEGLAKRVSKRMAMTNSRIRAYLKTEGLDIGDAEMRKIIQFIRQNNIVRRLCSSGKGYYVASTNEEWLEWLDSYRRRTNAMIYTLKCSIKNENTINFDQSNLNKI